MAPFAWGGPVEVPGPAFPLNLVFGFIEFLLSLFGLGGPNMQVITQAINNTWQNLVENATFLYNAEGFLSAAVDGLVTSFISALKHILIDVIEGTLLRIINEILKLLQKLHDFLAPLIAWLKKIQAMQRQLQQQYLRKFIDLIQRARKILVLFRLLHIGWAKKLDTYLATLESDVAAKWAKLIRQVNAITGVLDTVLDPRLLLRPGHALASIGGAIGAVQQATGALGLKQLLCLGPSGPAQPIIEPWAVTRFNFLTDAQSGSGAFADHRAEMYSAINAARADVGEPPLV